MIELYDIHHYVPLTIYLILIIIIISDFMKLYLAIIFIILLTANQASAVDFNSNDIEWAAANTSTLHKGGTMTNGDYMIKVVQFSASVPGRIAYPSGGLVPEDEVKRDVYIEIFRNGTYLRDVVININDEAYVDPDNEIKISVIEMTPATDKNWVHEYYDPWAKISFQKRGIPKLEVKVKTDKKTYTSNNLEFIEATVEVKNTGDAFIKNVDVDLKIWDLVPRGSGSGQLHRYYDKILKNGIISFSVVLLVPDLVEQKDFPLNATAIGYDIKEFKYNSTGSINLAISPYQNYFRLNKVAKKHLYLPDSTLVKISAKNAGIYDITDIHISDVLSDKFILSSSPVPFEWDIPLLKPGDEWTTYYSIRPIEANLGGWNMSEARATFKVNNKLYSNSSPIFNMIISGPILRLNKTVSKNIVNISEDVIVTVSVNNVGNVSTRTYVIDSLPDNVELVTGKLYHLNLSESMKKWGFSYIIRMNTEGEYELPKAIANYSNVEYKGLVRDVESSENQVIKVVDPEKVAAGQATSGYPGTQQNTSSGLPGGSASTSTPAPTPITPGFGIAFAVLVLIFAAGFMRR